MEVSVFIDYNLSYFSWISERVLVWGTRRILLSNYDDLRPKHKPTL